MKNKALYEKTVSILVDAYFNDTLVHGNQCGCAVGNIVAANMGIKLHKIDGGVLVPSYWDEDKVSSDKTIKNNGLWFDRICPDFMDKVPLQLINKQIKSTGYNWEQIEAIERAFENAQYSESEDIYMYNGLMAVIDVLDRIHENTDTNATEQTKNKFKKQLA